MRDSMFTPPMRILRPLFDGDRDDITAPRGVELNVVETTRKSA
jgi:hypothetical protein